MKKLALITGGTSGIGLGVAKALLADCDLALSYASNAEKARCAQEELTGMEPTSQVKTYSGPVMDFNEAKNLVENVRRDFGRGPDILITAAGRVRDGIFLGSDFVQHQELIAEHVIVPMAIIHQCLKEMYKNKFGRIINLSSISARYAKRGQVNYATAKAAIEGFTRTLALEVAHRGVTINAIAPGLIETPMTKEILQMLEQVPGGLKGKIPAARPGTAEEVGKLARFLVFDAPYITGQVVTIDGGRSLGDSSS